MVKLDIISCFYREVLNSNLSRPTKFILVPLIAQSVEQALYRGMVVGSSPTGRTIFH